MVSRKPAAPTSAAPSYVRGKAEPPRWATSPGALFAYSWLPGIGLNLIPGNTTPVGSEATASMVIAEETILIEVAAMAVVP